MQAASESGGCTQSSRYQQQRQEPQGRSHPLADQCTVVHHTNGERLWGKGTGLGARVAARCCWREMLSSAQHTKSVRDAMFLFGFEQKLARQGQFRPLRGKDQVEPLNA